MTLRRSATDGAVELTRGAASARRRAARCARSSDSRSCERGEHLVDELCAEPRRAARPGGGRPARRAGRPRAGSRARTRRCLRRASSTRPARARRRRSSTAWSAGCRRRSTSSRSRSPPSAGRRRAARGASGTASRRSPCTRPRTRTSGSRNWVPRTVPKSTRERSIAGSVSKNAMFSRSATTSGSRGSRLIAFRTGSPGAATGQASTQSGSRCSPRRRPAACSACRVGRLPRAGPTGTPPARPPDGTGRSTGSGSRCAGRRSCSCRTGCTGRCPRPRPDRRCCASRRRPCRSGRCRRPAAR